ncbi:MAG: hypothetical protein CL526_06240 [Aequorivita sp.]|nr:hypothetical protein [Aequorivita sp.]|tara:strand:+ start:75730 stop:76164 length:435 start_codon:yes stop_codon:yes gene_type:complete
MNSVNKNSIWFPGLLDNFLFEKNDNSFRNNYETFSIPAVNIIENLTNFAIEIAIPGFNKENLIVEAEEDTLKVTSKKIDKKEEDQESNQYLNIEFNYSSFERLFTLPDNINTEEIQASYTNGVLKIMLPKVEEKKALKKMVEIS